MTTRPGSRGSEAALGFRVHSGWAAVIAVAGPVDDPSHALIHAAEGELFRDVIRQASVRSALRLAEVKERDLEAQAVRGLRRPVTALQQRLAQWGKALGPPWTQDEKRAALVAWVALAARPIGDGSASDASNRS